jgi:hypothetical protein
MAGDAGSHAVSGGSQSEVVAVPFAQGGPETHRVDP